MARIRIGEFGGRVAPAVETPKPGYSKPRGASADVLVGATALLRSAREEDRRAAIELTQNEERARRNNAASVFARYQVNVEQLADGLGTQLLEGVTTREEAEKGLETGIADLRKKLVDPLDATSRADLGNNLELFDGRARSKFTGALQQHARQERLAGFNSTIEEYQRLAQTDRAGAVRQAQVLFDGEGVALLGKDGAGKAFQKFKEGAVFVDFDRRISASRMDARALGALREELASASANDLAPELRRGLEANIQGHEARIEHQAEVAMNRRRVTLGRQENRLRWYVENGHEIPGTELKAFQAQAKGTEFEGVVEQLVGEQRAVAQFSKLTPPQMIAQVKALETQYGATPSREQITHLARVRGFAERSIKMLNDTPFEYAEQRDGAVFERLDLTNPNTWAAQLSHRAAVMSEVSKRTGAAPKALAREEAQAITALLRDSKPADQAQILSTLRQGFADDRVFRATMQQVAGDDRVMAAAGIAAARGYETERDRPVADRILRGRELLRKKEGAGSKLKMPGDEELLRVFTARSRDAFANNSEAGHLFFDTARAIYAAKADDDGDISGVMNASRWQESIEEATGGFGQHNGRAIVMPYRMGAADFKDSLRRRFGHLVAQGKVEGWTAAQLMGLPLQNTGDGRYIARVGDSKLLGKDGKEVVIDFNVSAPFRPSGEAPDARPVTKAGRSSGK